MMKKKRMDLSNRCLLLICMICLWTFPAWAQTTVTGTVNDGTGNALPGVTVQLKGTTVATTTSGNGTFQINAPSTGTITFSMIGYGTQEVNINNRTSLFVILESESELVEEVVVVGYNVVKKSDLTGAVSSIGEKELKAMPVKDALQAMQGKVAGVDITSNQRPGTTGGIQIRGVRSITANQSPLYVVDGVTLWTGGIENINPSDIESIDVLKDASATAIYGSRGANGVVIVTTKRGTKGKMSLNYAGTTTFEKIHDVTEYMTAGEWTEGNAHLGPAGTTAGTKRFTGGDLAIKYIVNDAGDDRFKPVANDGTGVLKNGVMQNTHTFVRYFDGESQEWVGRHGNNGYYGAHTRSVALSKYRDGYRINIASQFGTRDAIMARSAEDVLMVAEAYIRKGEGNYPNAILWINKLRARAAYKEGENRSKHVDGGQAYKNNSYLTGKGGGFSADGAIFYDENSYYESNNDMALTTDASSLLINSVSDIYNSPVDMPIYEKLACNSNAEKMLCFLLNERTRELCGELYRWEDLARTKTLEARWKAFNDGFTRGNTVFNANTHYYRPIPQSFLDGITNENGAALSPAEKAAMQNPGY